jgi:hypothetical protein
LGDFFSITQPLIPSLAFVRLTNIFFPPCGFPTGKYLFYENGSTETFRRGPYPFYEVTGDRKEGNMGDHGGNGIPLMKPRD